MFKINEVFAFVANSDRDDVAGEAVMAATLSVDGQDRWIPLVCADRTKIPLLVPVAEKIAEVTGKPYRILKFSGREDITALYPPPGEFDGPV